MLFSNGKWKKNHNEELQEQRGVLWPLSMFMTFHEEDHLKNGEGFKKFTADKDGVDTNDNDNNSYNKNDDNGLSNRVRRLVSERTGGQCNPTSGEI